MDQIKNHNKGSINVLTNVMAIFMQLGPYKEILQSFQLSVLINDKNSNRLKL